MGELGTENKAPPVEKRRKGWQRAYELTHRFQTECIAELPWLEEVLGPDVSGALKFAVNQD